MNQMTMPPFLVCSQRVSEVSSILMALPRDGSTGSSPAFVVARAVMSACVLGADIEDDRQIAFAVGLQFRQTGAGAIIAGEDADRTDQGIGAFGEKTSLDDAVAGEGAATDDILDPVEGGLDQGDLRIELLGLREVGVVDCSLGDVGDFVILLDFRDMDAGPESPDIFRQETADIVVLFAAGFDLVIEGVEVNLAIVPNVLDAVAPPAVWPIPRFRGD